MDHHFKQALSRALKLQFVIFYGDSEKCWDGKKNIHTIQYYAKDANLLTSFPHSLSPRDQKE